MTAVAWNVAVDAAELDEPIGLTLVQYGEGGHTREICVILQQFALAFGIPKTTLVSRLRTMQAVTHAENLAKNLNAFRAAGALGPDGRVNKVKVVQLATAIMAAEANIPEGVRSHLYELEDSTPPPQRQVSAPSSLLLHLPAGPTSTRPLLGRLQPSAESAEQPDHLQQTVSRTPEPK